MLLFEHSIEFSILYYSKGLSYYPILNCSILFYIINIPIIIRQIIIIVTRGPMIRKFDPSPYLQKYHKKTNYNIIWHFDMTLADMDVGVHENLHSKILKTFRQALQNQCNIRQEQQKKNSNQIDPFLKLNPASLIFENAKKQAQIAIVNWYNIHFKCELSLKQKTNTVDGSKTKRVYVQFCPSVVSICSYCIMSLTQQKDPILIMTPVYASYANIIKTINRKVIVTQMKIRQTTDRDQNSVSKFYINQIDFSQKIKQAKMLLLCHPHNPSGRIWTKQQIIFIVKNCMKYGVTIISDQILSDLLLNTKPKKDHQFYSLCRQFKYYDKIVVLNSISKSFNYASLQAGYALTSNQLIKQSISHTIQKVFDDKIDLLGLCAIKSCLSSDGQLWLNEIKDIIFKNYSRLLMLASKFPLLKIAELQSAYLVYIDLSAYFKTVQQMNSSLNNNSIWVLNLSANYFPIKQQCRQIRVCIACQNQKFHYFIQSFQNVLMQAKSKHNKNPSPKL